MGCGASSEVHAEIHPKAAKQDELILSAGDISSAGISASVSEVNGLSERIKNKETTSEFFETVSPEGGTEKSSQNPSDWKRTSATDLPENQTEFGSNDEQESFDVKIAKLYSELVNGNTTTDWEILSKNIGVLCNGLLALGIGLDSIAFIEDSFKKSRTVDITSFQTVLKRELEISRKLVWLGQTGLFRCIAESLPPAEEESDPVSCLRSLERTEVFQLVGAMHQKIADCLIQSISNIPVVASRTGAEGQSNNSKFCADPKLFTMKCVQIVVPAAAVCKYLGLNCSFKISINTEWNDVSGLICGIS